MKESPRYLAVPTILLILLLISCHKDDTGYSGPIIGKWNIARHIDTTLYFNGPAIYLDYQPTTNIDYFDFTPDGKLYRFEDGVKDTSTFTLSQDTLIVTHKYPPYTTFIVEVSTKDSLQLNGVAYVIYNSHDVERTHYYLNKR